MIKDILEEFLQYECDGFQSIEVESRKPLILIFHTWDGRKFRLQINMLKEASEE